MAGSQLAKEASKWISEAETDKRLHQVWHRDGYKYAMPWRRRPGDESQQQPVHDQDELFDPTAIEALSDFAADAQDDYTPTEKDWLDVEPATTLNDVQAAQIKGPMKQYQNVVFSEIRRSNFHEASQESYPDLGLGTCAMCIQDLDVQEPLHCQAIPITDLLLVRGVYGGVDFRGRKSSPKYSELKATYPKANFPPALLSKIGSNNTGRAKVVECCWRLRDKPTYERWQYVLLVDQQECESDIYEGAGSCPIIPARWRTDSTTAWGIGAIYATLPTIKTLDQLCYLILKHLNLSVDPIRRYDADGTISVDNGVLPGTWIPSEPGSKIDTLETDTDFNPAFFERAAMQMDVKRSLFQDKPEQRGKTPPTASQWMQEGLDNDKRKGSPIGRLRTEWQWAIFARFAYLLARRGILPEVKLNGEAIRLRPQSPLIRAQRQEEVITADKLLEIIGARFGPNTTALVVDVLKTVEKFKEGLGADRLILRDEQTIKQMIAAAGQQLQQAQQQQPQQQPNGAVQ